MEIASIDKVDFSGRRVLVRVDFNVPIENGIVTDDTRIREALPTLQLILNKGGSLVLLSHLGRPQGKRDVKYSLAPVAKQLAVLLGLPVTMAPDVVGPAVEDLAFHLKPGEVLMLENLRFYAAEEDPEQDPSFAEKLSRLGTFYINDAFGTAHRAHSSTATIVQYFPHAKGMGLLMAKEVAILSKVFEHPDRPFYALIGGAKIDSKIGILYSLLEKADALFIGGAMAFTFFKAKGIGVGKSLIDAAHIATAQKILTKAHDKGIPIYLPLDVVTENGKTFSMGKGLPDSAQGLDIGEETVLQWKHLLNQAKTVFWNGPMGMFEKPPFEQGTLAMANVIAALDATTVIGGGDSAAAVQKLGFADRFTHISTGGGAALEFIEFGSLVAINALKG